MVAPPRFASGGGAAGAFGGSGAPALPVPDSARAMMLQKQYADDERGRFTERVFVMPPFPALTPGGSTVPGAVSTQSFQVTSNRTSFVRLVAARGVLINSSQALTGLEPGFLSLSLSINGEEEMTTGGNVGRPASFATLFSDEAAPWFWFAAPPRLRVGDTMQATVINNVAEGEGSPNLTPEVAVRLVDDEWWQALYGEALGVQG
jgi:hypothetical protein